MVIESLLGSSSPDDLTANDEEDWIESREEFPSLGDMELSTSGNSTWVTVCTSFNGLGAGLGIAVSFAVTGTIESVLSSREETLLARFDVATDVLLDKVTSLG